MPATRSNLAATAYTSGAKLNPVPKPRPALRNLVPRRQLALLGRPLLQGQRLCSFLGVAALARSTSALGKRSTN